MTMTYMTNFRRTQGYILMEVMVAMFIFASMATYALYAQNMESKAEQGRLLGQQYLAINKAVGNYMVTHYAALEKLPVGCSQTSFAVGTAPWRDTSLDCGLPITTTVSIANGMQPTVLELIAAGFLEKARVGGGSSVGVPTLPMDSTVQEVGFSTGVAATSVARLFINIDRVCLATHTTPPGSASLSQVPGASGCPALTTTSLTSLIFNTQPYTFSTQASFGFANRMGSLWSEIGADAAMSNMTTGGELKGANFQITNPVRKSATNTGVGGIVVVRNGYGAAYANNHARVDGSNPPTADWSFANNNINDVTKLTVKTVDAQTVVAKLVDAEVLKLGDRTEGDACDATKENVSFGAGTILMCTASKWTPLSAKGTVNGLDYYEFVLNKYSGQGMTLDRTRCPKSGCLEGYSFQSSQNYFSTSFKKDEWLPVLVRFQDDPNGLNGLTQSDYGFQVDGLGNYMFMFNSGAGALSQLFNTGVANIVVRFYRINP